MAKAKKQQHKIKSLIKKIEYNEEHSLPNHDSESRKHTKEAAKRLRRITEKDDFDKE